MAITIDNMIKTTKPAVPKIYAYTTPEIAKHDGWTKIGYTEGDVDERIKQQTHTADVKAVKEWDGLAYFEDGTGSFRDHEFHGYLRKLGIKQEEGKNNEWFEVTPVDSKGHFYDFRSNHGIIGAIGTAIPYQLRKEQELAVKETVQYAKETEDGEFLWNCKPRFGKTLSVYDFCKKIKAEKVLIVTNRPAIANSWYSDYVMFMGEESGFKFVSETDALKGKPYVLSRDEYLNFVVDKQEIGCIEFLSLQDLKGAIRFGGKFDKLNEVADIEWDVLVIDEAHEGVDTYKTDVAFDQIKRKFTLHLSGTPFKALAGGKFEEKAIYNWTYADEQTAKREWEDEEKENPYAALPKLNMFTFLMSEIVRDEVEQGIEINGETEEFAFDLNEFFATFDNGAFKHDSAVDKFLDALTTQKKFPFSTDELRNELKHTMWLLNRVDSAKALARKLKDHPVFKEYEVVLAAGDGKLSDDEEYKKSFDKVKAAIEKHDKTITLTVGQLTTGVTIPEWTAVMMLSNIQSAPLYMQAAFRAQNPCLFNEGGEFRRKENAYVFDFDPARTLNKFEEFANDLSPKTAGGRGDTQTRKENIKRLLNFFPVIGEDEEGEMVELDAEKVLSIPRKIKSQEVVKRGFMSNFLFQNVSGIFSAPKEVLDILDQLTPVEEPKRTIVDTVDESDEIKVDENGEVVLDEDQIKGIDADLFGNKIYEIEDVIITVEEGPEDTPSAMELTKQKIKETIVDDIVEKITEEYNGELKKSEIKQIDRILTQKSDEFVTRAYGEHEIQSNILTQEKLKEIAAGKSEDEVNKKYEKLQKKADESLKETIEENIKDFVPDATLTAVKTAEKKVQEHEKDSIKEVVRDHLRGFTRTIPSFLMAYGDDSVTLATFDEVVPGKVFLEVTSITLEQFKFLRDGGNYTDEETGEEKHYAGNLFDPIVFDDSVKEFLRLKQKLANYFDEASIEDIFDYIPPQKTNQIFTPKKMVKKMVDMLEEENPGCFDDKDKTFIDLYMKSGLYITEIVKRLYNSEKMKKEFPDNKERLKHIFANQVYGLAPTEIIYNIAMNYILGFSDDIEIEKHNFRMADALPYAKEGNIDELLESLYDDE